MRAFEYYSCTGRGLHAAAQCTCAWDRMSTLLHLQLHASHDSCRSFFCCGRVTAYRASSCIMPSISDRSGIVKGRSPPERRGKLLFFTSKRNERETRHVLTAATRLHLPPEAIRSLVELVRSRRLFMGSKNRPIFFNGGRERRFLAKTRSWNVASTEHQHICSCDIWITRSTLLYVWVHQHLPLVESPLQTDISGLCFSFPSPPTATIRELLPEHWLLKQPSLAKARWFCKFGGVTMSGSEKTEKRPR